MLRLFTKCRPDESCDSSCDGTAYITPFSKSKIRHVCYYTGTVGYLGLRELLNREFIDIHTTSILGLRAILEKSRCPE